MGGGCSDRVAQPVGVQDRRGDIAAGDGVTDAIELERAVRLCMADCGRNASRSVGTISPRLTERGVNASNNSGSGTVPCSMTTVSTVRSDIVFAPDPQPHDESSIPPLDLDETMQQGGPNVVVGEHLEVPPAGRPRRPGRRSVPASYSTLRADLVSASTASRAWWPP